MTDRSRQQHRSRWQGRLLFAVLTAFTTALLAPATSTAQDTTPPYTSIYGPFITRDSQPVFNLTSSEPESTFQCSLDSGPLQLCGPLSFQPLLPLAEGPHNLLAFATDPAGNTDPTGRGLSFTIDHSIAGGKLSGARRQPTMSRGDIRVKVRLFATEDAFVKVSGIVVVGNGDQKKALTRIKHESLNGRRPEVAELSATNEVNRAVARALMRGERVRVRVSARFRDEVQNELTKKLTIILF